jgi:hypothetical protein
MLVMTVDGCRRLSTAVGRRLSETIGGVRSISFDCNQNEND